MNEHIPAAEQHAYVMMIGNLPVGVAGSLEEAQAAAVASETRHRSHNRELRWADHPDGQRLMARTGGRGRFAWTMRWVAEVPRIRVSEGGAR